MSKAIKKYCTLIGYTEETTGGEICKGDEDCAWPSHDQADIQFDPKYVRRGDKHFFGECAERVFNSLLDVSEIDEVYVVIPRHSDGDTFGHTSGYWEIEGLYLAREDAHEAAELVRSRHHPKDSRWSGGYFGGFEGVNVHKLPVIDEKTVFMEGAK